MPEEVTADPVVALVRGAGDVDRFRPDPVPRALVDLLVEAATSRRPTRHLEPPWRLMVVVGEERDRLISRTAEALGRHAGQGSPGPRGLGSEAVLAAPVLVLVFSTEPASESAEAFALVAGMLQNLILLAHGVGLGTHRISGVALVPEAALDYAAEFLGPEIRGGDLVGLLALGWPEGEPTSSPGDSVRATWVGDGPPPIPPEVAATAAQLRPPAEVLRSPRRERVMAVDGYAYNRALLEAQLTRAGYSVEVYSSGEALLGQVAERGPPDLYLISDTLPDTSGFELVRQTTRGASSRTPVIVTTARRDSAFRIGGLSAGVDYYLRKPVNAVELLTAARILLQRSRLVAHLRQVNAELERVLEERAAAQARLVQHAKMAALGQLVAGVAHEINTPLAAVVSNTDLFARCFDRLRETIARHPIEDPETSRRVARDLDAVNELIGVSRAACQRITGIVRTLRTFARLDEAEVKAVDLHEGIESTLVLIAHLLKGGIRIVRRFGELPCVECHPNQLNQIFMNLLVNACHAMGDEGTITITTRNLHDQVEVEVADTGCGIPAEKLGRIFDPGFTTKGATIGTGLGLSIVYQIVEGHGGEIRVESEVGKGTVFTLRLPARRGPLSEPPALGAASLPR